MVHPHDQHTGLNSVNDQVLTAISLDYGKNAAQPGADLQKTLQPIVDAEKYRARLRTVSRVVTPAVGAGTITWVFTPVGTERWKVTAAALENGDAAAHMNVALGVRDQANISGERRVANVRVLTSSNDQIVGWQSLGDLTAASGAVRRGSILSFIDIPRATELLIIVTPNIGVFDGSEIALRMLIEVLPQEVAYVLTEPSTEIVP